MGRDTKIEWCDSTLNLQMGCDGCELWNPAAGVKHCYAGTLTNIYAGASSGFPESFDQPKLFLERLDTALKWSDLTGMPRPLKPWLNGLPRLIFLNDMGDTFTESLPLDWLAPLLPRLAESPHQFLLLTKRPKRMAQFCASHPFPRNVWPGTSITASANVKRIEDLILVEGGGPKFVSAEPLLGPVSLMPWLHYLDWVIVGGESGTDARPMHLHWPVELRDQCEATDVPFFFKQWGEWQNGSSFQPHAQAAVLSNGRFVFPDSLEGREQLDRELGGQWSRFHPISMSRVGTAAAGCLLNGQHYHQMPRINTPCPAR